MGNQKYKQAHKEHGLCSGCSRPVHPGYSRCLTHIRTHNANAIRSNFKRGEAYLQYHREYKELRRQQGLCTSCGGPVEDNKHITCCNCREKLYFERFENAVAII